MNRAVIVYASALLLALGGAYWTWTHEVDPDRAETVVVLPGEIDQLEQVTYESDKITLTILMKEDEVGRYAWVRAAPKAGAEDASQEPVSPEIDPHEEERPDDGKTEEFKAGSAGDQLLEQLAPFRAKRILDGITDDKLAELGLEDPDGTLTIKRKGRDPVSYQVGGNVYGGANVYVRNPEDGKVYLVDSKVVRTLQSAKRTLPDRNLVGTATKDIRRIRVFTQEASATFEQRNPADPQATFWSVAGQDEANAAGAGWIDKALRLRSSRYVPDEEAPSGLEEAFGFEVEASDGKTTTVTVYRTWGTDGEDEWYARSGHTRALVQLRKALAAETMADLPSVLEAGQGS